MARLVRSGGDVRVVMVTDGTTPRPGRSDTDAEARRNQRNQETLSALAMLGIPETRVAFFGISAELGLRRVETVREGIERLAKVIAEFQPDAVIAPAFEGGHPDHDSTNYMVARAAAKAALPVNRVFEACEYNGYFLSSAVLGRLNGLMLVRFALPPRFIPGRNRAMRLDMNKSELEHKHALLRRYRSQKPDTLVQLFGYPDQFRPIEAYNYSRGPYDPAGTARYRLCRALGGTPERCNPFDYGISLRGYAELYSALEETVNAA
ncbi:MAG: PIG-L family deacetylase [Deltaproteobacteria bacterium]|nr:PIG-L family deacetylase [Deltaproteobacteria bacterium]